MINMKWSLQQLLKLSQQPYEFEETYDFIENINSIDDIISSTLFNVKGTVHHLYDDRYEFNLNIKGELTLQDARTLDPVAYPIDLNVIEVFDKVASDDEDVRIIEKNTIDLYDVVWENILLEKPIRVVKE